MQTKDLFDTISQQGILVDVPGLELRQDELLAEESDLVKQLDQATDFASLRVNQPSYFKLKGKNADVHFNPRSKKHINAWLVARGEDETHSVSEENLGLRLPQDLADLIMATRRKRKAHGDLQTIRDNVEIDGRIRVEWVEAVTGRWYTGAPPIQTLGKIVRNYLVPEQGNGFYIIDWSQQELRILAKLSQEPALLDVFQNGGDPHVLAFEKMTGRKFDDLPDADRKRARDLGKLMNYALIYGLDAVGLGARLRIDNATAQSLIDNFFKGLPVLKAWRDSLKQQGMQVGYVETMIGRRIPISTDTSNKKAVEKAGRQVVSYTVQGSAADQLVDLMHRLEAKSHTAIKLVRATIHDALLLELPNGEKGNRLARWFGHEMEQPFMGVDAPTEIKGPADTWADAMDFVEDAPE